MTGGRKSDGKEEMEKRYGFVYVDSDDYGKGSFARSRKDSFYRYKKIIASNGEDPAWSRFSAADGAVKQRLMRYENILSVF